MSKELEIKYNTDHGDVKLSPAIIRKYLVSGGGNVSDQEIVMFMQLCRYQGLNPFLREAYLIKYGNSPATIITSKDTFTKRAEKHDNYDGATAGICVVKESGSLDQRTGTLLLLGEKLVGGWARVYRKNWKIPVEITVSYAEYEGKKSNGETNRQWKRMPATMIRKVALVQALREAFPDQFQGLYDSAEMQIDSSELNNEPINVTPSEESEKKQQKKKQTNPSPHKKTEQKEKVPKDPERQKIIDEIGTILNNDKFTKDDRIKVRIEISVTKSNIALEALRAVWQGKLNKLEENFVDDIPGEPITSADNDSGEQLTKEQMADLEKTADQGWFTDEKNAAKEAAEKKKMQEEDIF